MHTTKNLKETQKIAKLFGKRILKASVKRKHALVIALSGDLGSGKTSFTQGLAESLGIKERVLSPTFILERVYELKRESFKRFIHIDAYRLKDFKDMKTLGWDDIVKNPKHIIVIEWAEKIKKILPKGTVWIHFKYIDEKTRSIIHAPSL